MTIPTLSTLPVAPARTDPPATFVTRADAFLAAIVTFQGEMNTSIGAMNTDIAGVNADAVSAAADAVSAAASAAAAEAASNAAEWVSGTSYAEGDVVYSPIDFKSYRANTATSGTTDPSASADWTVLGYELPTQTGNSGKFLTTDGTDESWGTIAIPASGLTTNTRQAVTSAATTAIDIDSGQVVDLTMAANITTLSFSNVPASGTPILVKIVVKNASDGTAYTIAWPSSVYWNSTTIQGSTTSPDLASGAGGVTVISILTTDGGTKWRGWVDSSIVGGVTNNMWLWGNGDGYRLGRGATTADAQSPVNIEVGQTFIFASRGEQSGHAIRSDGTLWGWGSQANYGIIGDESSAQATCPRQVGSETDWFKCTTGFRHAGGLRGDGILYMWGYSGAGGIGNNSTSQQMSPVQIGSSNWIDLATSEDSTMAIRSDGTMWGWGDGNNYRTGIGTETDRSSPVQCGVGTGFVQLSMGETHGHAVKSDGTLWCWGNGGDQKNGNGSTAEIQTPSQVGSDTDWKQCSSGYTHGMAIKTDNTLYGWGENGNGEVGVGTTAKVTFPTQIGSDTWLKVSTKLGTPKGTYAVKSDNTLWSWGEGSGYNLGHGGGTSYSAPQQVGTDTDWNDVFDGSRNYSGTIAFKGPKINPS